MPLSHRNPALPAMPDFRSPDFLIGHVQHTLAFYDGRSLDPHGGFFHFFKDDGTVYDRRTRHLVSSTRFVFNNATAWRRFGRPEHLAATRHGLDFLQRAHAHPQGGYLWELDWHQGRAQVRDGTHYCYGLAFVLLAHAHAAMAGVDEARAGIERTWQLLEQHFWEPRHQLYANEATADWTVSPYRGQNANMHACEAMMAAFEATGDAKYLDRAATLAQAIALRQADLTGGRVWEHFHEDWSVDADHNRGNRADIFKPWGFQTGHLTEWAKLLLQLEGLLAGRGVETGWMLPRAQSLFEAAMRHGWDAEFGGLVYGFDPEGALYDGDKYFWVQAESFAAAALLAVRTGESRYWDWYDRIWDYAWRHMVDHEHGAWFRILSRDNRKLGDEKSPAGKTDYHTMGACHDVLRALGA
ncbi:N-acylglucosamine 2-epimerase [Variovorax paradoxus]|nr:N-acylglucosamine 2-epimerase [Variovorax paradoxus]KPV06541.1 N-acylglucosamine 2-epimerase [Variovorax paradoxus]KPV08447.1 N-acylglucosamine 2-epimerase [Variovorax paradoxus]KPV21949.1 N-acylglucosamine 2-epimerase [Variovorax paradoxus]KPV32034.1 N-acylglucosamine 2-epimerase [Variovorax paradoxus]